MTKTTNIDRRAYFLNAATEAFNNGFTSKAGAKAAMDDLNRVWDSIERELKDACLAARTVVADVSADGTPFDHYEMSDAVSAVYWDFADYPHLFKAKHRDQVAAAFGDRFDALMDFAAEVVALRAAIKAAPIVAPVKDETKVQAARIVETIRARMDRLNVRYLEAIDLTTVFEDGFVMKGLSANSHYVTNEHGTTFLRTFFYLNGKLTPLNLILAAAQEARRQAEAEGR